jgi:hypothetical protein
VAQKNVAARETGLPHEPEPALPQSAGNPIIKPDVGTPRDTIPTAAPETPAKAEAPVKAETLPGTAAPAETEVPEKAETSAGTEMPAERRIAETIKNMTIRPEHHDGAEMKKISREIPREMSALKSLLVRSDMKDEEGYLKRIDQTLRQMELTDRTVRFEHMQLPVMDRAGEYRTAELYVFRNRSGRRDAGEAGVAILVALDTRHIGRTETLIREAGGGVSLEFRLERANAAEIFKSQTGVLAQAVEAAGYRLTGVRFTGLERRTTVVNAGETAGPETGKTPHGVDVRI